MYLCFHVVHSNLFSLESGPDWGLEMMVKGGTNGRSLKKTALMVVHGKLAGMKGSLQANRNTTILSFR